MEILKLIWDSENRIWKCPYCGAVYERPEDWIPKTNWCMKCRNEWADLK